MIKNIEILEEEINTLNISDNKKNEIIGTINKIHKDVAKIEFKTKMLQENANTSKTLFNNIISEIDKKNKLIQEINEELEAADEELRQNNEELQLLNENIYNKKNEIEKSYQNVKTLSKIGQQITANLEVERIVDTVYENVNVFMDASTFSIGIFNSNYQRIEFKGGKEKGETLPFFFTSLTEVDRPAIQCFTKQKDIIINTIEDYRKFSGKDAVIGELPESIIYLPLITKNAVIGVITVQSFQKNAYTDYHLNILRNIAIYTSIALENADALQQIEEQNAEIQAQAEELKDKNDKLTELNATKDKLFSIIAHDLKSPFNALLGFSELLLENHARYDNKKLETYIKLINDGLKKTYRLLENLLSWAQVQTGIIKFTPEKINIESLINEIILLMTEAAGNKEIKLISKTENNLLVNADKNMIDTVIRNLVSNAIKFTSKEGDITIKSHTITDKNNQKFAEISIKDSGVGITPEIQTKLFSITENISTKGTENEKGTGLGLILCKEFVEKHGGEIWVESEVEQGSEFLFTIPF